MQTQNKTPAQSLSPAPNLSGSVDGHWYGTFTGGAQGLEVILRAAGGELAGSGYLGALAERPVGSALAGTLGADGTVRFSLRARGSSSDAAPLATFEGTLSDGALRGSIGGQAISLQRAPKTVAAPSISWATVTFINYSTQWTVEIKNQSSGCTWQITSGPPFFSGSGGKAAISGFILWPSWYEATEVLPPFSPFGASFQFEWQDTANPAPLSLDHSWVLVPAVPGGHTLYPTGGTVSYG